jgi:hypothetical protein
LFRPRLTWGLATAVLLIAVSVLGIYVVSRRASAPQSVVSNPASPSKTSPVERSGSAPQNYTSNAGLAGSHGSNSVTAPVPRPGSRPHNATQARANLPPASKAAPVPASLDRPAQVSDSHLPYGSDGSRAPLRMEIQTKNPNIRIIWLTPRDAKSPSPNSKGT